MNKEQSLFDSKGRQESKTLTASRVLGQGLPTTPGLCTHCCPLECVIVFYCQDMVECIVCVKAVMKSI